MNYNDFFALAENKGINRIQVTETYIKKNEIVEMLGVSNNG